MNNKNLTILALLAIIMVILAGITSQMSNSKSVKVGLTKPLIQGLNPENISKIEVTSAGSTTSILRQGQNFVLESKENYPAQIKKVNELITRTIDIKVSGQPLTSNKDNHTDLGVGEDSAEKIVKFMDSQNNLITGIIIGKRLDAGETTTRLSTSDEVYTTSSNTWFTVDQMGFIDSQLINTSQDSISKITVKSGNQTYEIANKEGNIEFITDLPTGKQLKATDYTEVFNALSNLNFSDVMAADKASNINFDTIYTCQLNDSTVYTLKISNKDEKYFITCSAKFTDFSQVEISQNESQEDLKKKEAKLLARDNSAKFNNKHAGWVYEIPSYKAEDLTKTLEELTEDIPAELPPADANGFIKLK